MRSGRTPGVSVANPLSWAVSHAKGRVMQSITTREQRKEIDS